MKLISLIGNDPMKVILPLTQLTNMIDGAYFLVSENNYPMAERILNSLSAMEQDGEGPGWEDSVEIVVFSKDAEYTEIYRKIREILDREYSCNEEVAFNHDGGNLLMQRASRFTAYEMLAPRLIVDTVRFRMRLSFIMWDRKTFVGYDLPCAPIRFSLETTFRLYGLDFRQDIQKNSSKGYRYERKIYEEFLEAKTAGTFSDLERNLIFTWNTETGKKNEIDLIVLRRGVIGFISIKSGKGLRKASAFGGEYKKMIQRYPDSLAGKPCLKMLISKEKIPQGRFFKMMANQIVAIDDVWADGQTHLAVELAAAGCDHIAKTGRPLPYDFYHRFINRQYGKWGNEIGKMRKEIKNASRKEGD